MRPAAESVQTETPEETKTNHDMETMETVSGQRFVRFQEILQWIINDENSGKRFRSIDELDWTVMASISQYIFEKHLNEEEPQEDLIREADAESEAKLYFTLDSVVCKIKRRFDDFKFVSLTEVIDFLRDNPQVNLGGEPFTNFTDFFSSEEYKLVEKYRDSKKANANNIRRTFTFASLSETMHEAWLERCIENQERLSRVALAFLSTATLGILTPTLLWQDYAFLELVIEESKNLVEDKNAEYNGLVTPILFLLMRDRSAELLLRSRHPSIQGHIDIATYLYERRTVTSDGTDTAPRPA